MKAWIWNIITPLTVISFATFTKWWYALPVDAPDTIFYGFPFPYVGEAWHTSLSLQYFVDALLVDFAIYFLFLNLLIFVAMRILKYRKPHKALSITLWTIAIIIISLASFVVSNPNNLIYLKRPYEIDVMTTGYQFIWQQPERPNYYDFRTKPTQQ